MVGNEILFLSSFSGIIATQSPKLPQNIIENKEI
jgi:hypothetical protein